MYRPKDDSNKDESIKPSPVNIKKRRVHAVAEPALERTPSIDSYFRVFPKSQKPQSSPHLHEFTPMCNEIKESAISGSTSKIKEEFKSGIFWIDPNRTCPLIMIPVDFDKLKNVDSNVIRMSISDCKTREELGSDLYYLHFMTTLPFTVETKE